MMIDYKHQFSSGDMIHRLDFKENKDSNYVGFQIPVFYSKKHKYRGIVSIVSYEKDLYDIYISEADRQFAEYIERIKNLKEGDLVPYFMLDKSLDSTLEEFKKQPRFTWQFVLKTKGQRKLQLIPLESKLTDEEFDRINRSTYTYMVDPEYLILNKYKVTIKKFNEMMSPQKDWRKGKKVEVKKILRQDVRETLKNELTYRVLMEL